MTDKEVQALIDKAISKLSTDLELKLKSVDKISNIEEQIEKLNNDYGSVIEQNSNILEKYKVKEKKESKEEPADEKPIPKLSELFRKEENNGRTTNKL